MKEEKEKVKVYEQILDNNWTAITFATLDGIVEYANRAAHHLYRYEVGELIGKHVDIFNTRETVGTEEIIQAIITEGGWTGELQQRRKDDTTFFALLTVWLVYDDNGTPVGYASNSKDVTISKQNESELLSSLREKEVLLAEVHHRVKNNLQLISSLLNLQNTFIANEKINRTIDNIQARIRAMSLIHEKLYISDLSRISVKQYTSELFRNIVTTNTRATPVEIELDVVDISLEIEKMLPLGLMLNELITNSIKHAFVDQPDGLIAVVLKEREDRTLELSYRDNGQGFEPNLGDGEDTPSFGSLLITTFAEQLDADLAVASNEEGTKYDLSFSY